MLEMITYIGKTNIDTFNFNPSNYEDYFISSNDPLSVHVANRQLTQNKGHRLNGVLIIKVFDAAITTFMDWDDIDLIWIGLLEMTLEYKKTGTGKHNMFMNNQEWHFKKITTKPENLILFSIKRNPLIFENPSQLGVSQEAESIINETDLLSGIVNQANEFISFRQKLFRMDSVNRLKTLMTEIQTL